MSAQVEAPTLDLPEIALDYSFSYDDSHTGYRYAITTPGNEDKALFVEFHEQDRGHFGVWNSLRGFVLPRESGLVDPTLRHPLKFYSAERVVEDRRQKFVSTFGAVFVQCLEIKQNDPLKVH